ncbi:MAG: cell division protein FtsZ [Bacillaceae bacterium]|nr:cell division protein FtsZ [Bacillaceae bacterium]
MGQEVSIFIFKQSVGNKDMSQVSQIEPDDICFFRFRGGNPGETEEMVESLYRLKETQGFLIGIFRFPFKFEGKKRLETAVMQYHQMKGICDAVTYFDSDGMMELMDPEVPYKQAQETIESLEEAPVRIVEEMVRLSGEINIDVHDIKTLLKGDDGPVFIRTIEGDSFNEPLKYAISAPYLAPDYAEGRNMIVNIGYAREVDMNTFRHMTLRLNDLFHKADILKMGTYSMDEPGQRFKVSLFVTGIEDPYPLPEQGVATRINQRYQIRHKWNLFKKKCVNNRWMNMVKNREEQAGPRG